MLQNLIVLRCAVVECISALTVDTELQLSFLQAGVLWYLISFLFIYDFTLGESGIESSKEHNQQVSVGTHCMNSFSDLAD